MSQKKPAKKKPARNMQGFTEEERSAARERIQELRADKADGEGAVLAKLAAMSAPDRSLGERLHAIVKASAPVLSPKTWYGMPAYANKDGQVVCFFQDSRKFKTRYATFGFSDKANLDEGHIWPTAYALTELTPADEAKIAGLLKKAVS